jgi:DHA1 family multidrug resistance protein-like MFS transporter
LSERPPTPTAGAEPVYRWRRSFYILVAAQFVSAIAISAAIPFLPLYLQVLGVRDPGENAIWAGVLVSGTALVMATASPIWGAVADRFGRKMMVTRVMFGYALVIALIAFAPNAAILLVLRLIMGALGGFNSAMNALVTSVAPRERMSSVLGLNQTAQFVGITVGPLVGGLIADHFGFRPAFLFTALLCLGVGVAVAFLVEERFAAPSGKVKAPARARVRELAGNRALMLMAVALFGIQFANLFISPIMPLFVQTLGVPADQVATTSGLALSAVALPSALAAINTGRLAGWLGLKWLLFVSLLGAGLLSLPQAFVVSLVQLLVLRGAMGLFSGLAIPSASSIVGQSAPPERRATAFGVSGSAALFGQALAPISGGLLAASAGLHGTFLVSGAAFLLASLLVGLAVREPHPAAPDEPQPRPS